MATLRRRGMTSRRLPASLAAALMAVASAGAHAGAVPDQVTKDAEAGFFHRALAVLEPLARQYPQDAEVQFRYGQALSGVGRSEPAIAAIKLAISLDPNDGVYHRALGEAYQQQIFDGQVGVFSALSVAKSAFREYQTAVQLAPSDLKAHVDLATYYFLAPGFAGGSYSKAHAEEDAVGKLDKVAELRVRAEEAGHKGDDAAGVALLQQAVQLDKTSASPIALGVFYVEAKRYAEALQTFRDTQAKYPDAYAAWYQVGRIAVLANEDHDEGIAALKHYLGFAELPDTIPGRGWAHLRLGQLYADQGHADLARAEYDAAAGLQGEDTTLAGEIKKARSSLD